MVRELQTDKNRWFPILKEFYRENTIIILVSLALISSIISWARAERAIDDAKEAMAEVRSQNADIEGYRESVEVTKNRVGKLRLEVDQLEEQIDER